MRAKNDKRRESLRGVCGPALRVPTRLAVGFGLEALEALASFTPDGGKPSLCRFPRSSAPRIRLASRHLRRRGECIATGVGVKPGHISKVATPAGRGMAPARISTAPTTRGATLGGRGK